MTPESALFVVLGVSITASVVSYIVGQFLKLRKEKPSSKEKSCSACPEDWENIACVGCPAKPSSSTKEKEAKL